MPPVLERKTYVGLAFLFKLWNTFIYNCIAEVHRQNHRAGLQRDSLISTLHCPVTRVLRLNTDNPVPIVRQFKVVKFNYLVVLEHFFS